MPYWKENNFFILSRLNRLMASSFAEQIPCILHLVKQLRPRTILDIGKGFGKYGFLLHEYVGIDNTKKIDPSKTMVEQSVIRIDAIEADKDLLLPHLPQFYNRVFVGDVFDVFFAGGSYNVVLMIDVIEHLDKEKAVTLLQHFVRDGAKVIVATPLQFFKQELYESEYEHHISHWTKKDFDKIGYVDCQYFDAGAVYLLSADKLNVRGFGNTLIKKLRRIARLLKNEF